MSDFLSENREPTEEEAREYYAKAVKDATDHGELKSAAPSFDKIISLTKELMDLDYESQTKLLVALAGVVYVSSPENYQLIVDTVLMDNPLDGLKLSEAFREIRRLPTTEDDRG